MELCITGEVAESTQDVPEQADPDQSVSADQTPDIKALGRGEDRLVITRPFADL